MIISSRKLPPTMAMRRAPSSNSTLTLSSNSTEFVAKYGFRHLLDSPLPSPALPSIVPRHGKKPNPHRFRKYLRFLLRFFMWSCGLFTVYWLALTMVRGTVLPRTATYLASQDETFEFFEDDELPKEPAVVMVVNSRGKPKWTVSIPPGSAFPLQPSEYAVVCHQSSRIVERIRASQSLSSHQHGGSPDYYRNDPYFTDIAEAEAQGFLPTASDDINLEKKKRVVGIEGEGHIKQQSTAPRQNGAKVCSRSLTYVMESTDAGLGMTLLGLWMSYGLAKKEGRAFFIDDTNW